MCMLNFNRRPLAWSFFRCRHRHFGWVCAYCTILMLAGLNFSFAAESSSNPMNFQSDIEFLKEYTDVILLQNGSAAVAVAPAYQGRVMTST
ncbi:MAG: DUF6786 family protein, partial [Pirellulales bacterium]